MYDNGVGEGEGNVLEAKDKDARFNMAFLYNIGVNGMGLF